MRTKGGVSRQRILNDPAFARTRENGLEFGQSAASGKMLGIAIGSILFKAKDVRLSSRLLKLMFEIKTTMQFLFAVPVMWGKELIL